MKTPRPYELKERIYQMCNDKQYFIAGTNTQYDMMFYAAGSEEFSCRDVAVMIWTCSICADVNEIEKQLMKMCEEIEEEARQESADDAGETWYEEIG